MDFAPQASAGLARRRRRLPEEETEQRMLAAAIVMVNRAGLSVSLEHISFEDVIRIADVSRSSAYRRWPYKDLFFSDVVRQLAKTATPSIVTAETQTIRHVVVGHLDWLATPELRHGLVVELVRQLALLDFQALCASPQWRTYIGLHATLMSLEDDELRDQVRSGLADSERAHVARVARAWEYALGLLGYRLRPEIRTTFASMAVLLDAAMRGLVIMAMSMPELASERTTARPFGAANPDDWSLPAVGLGSMVLSLLEPDPEIEWDARRLADVRQELLAVELPDA